MRRAIVTLLVGEPLLLMGLYLAWVPLAFIAAGLQAVAFGLFAETPERRSS